MFTERKLSKFSSNLAILYHDDQNRDSAEQTYLYHDVIDGSRIIQEFLVQDYLKSRNYLSTVEVYVGVLMNQCPVIVPIIIGILNSDAAFFCINPAQPFEHILNATRRFGGNILISDENPIKSHPNVKILKELNLFNTKIYILHLTEILEVANAPAVFENEIMFCATTSGSTGGPKLIRIPYKCFLPNVYSLSKLYNLTPKDNIFISSPPTFDPFVCDLCLALFSGATIVMASTQLRLSPSKLNAILFCNKSELNVTVMQMTPSLFKRWREAEIKEIILSGSLRCLILGGEPFPSMKVFKKWIPLGDCKTRIFNIYGLTELSCWALIYEVTLEDIEQEREIPIGTPLDDYVKMCTVHWETKTRIVRGVGELVLRSSIRRCFINDLAFSEEDHILTGDIVELQQDNRMVFRTRLDNIVKKYGVQVNLSRIEETICQLDEVEAACCLYDKGEILLFVATSSSITKGSLDLYLKQRPDQSYVQDIIILKNLPLSLHGKISKKELVSLYRTDYKANPEIESYFVHLLNSLFHKYYELDEFYRKSFIDLGGNSFMALNLVTKLEDTYSGTFPELISMLLDNSKSICEIFAYLRRSTVDSPEIEQTIYEPSARVKLIWKQCFGKCIDASPTICIHNETKYVTVGSHAHRLLTLNFECGKTVSSISLPDRIESKVTQLSDECGIVGCYDGQLYCFNFLSGTILWTFNSQGMIKSNPKIFNGKILFGNYNDSANLWCLNAESGSLFWSKKVGTKSMLADPCCISSYDSSHIEMAVVCTLDGTCACVNIVDGQIIWQQIFESPIFSSPRCISQCKVIVLAEVVGKVYGLTYAGEILWSFKADGNIFSSFEMVQSLSGGNNCLISFGCHDNHLYGLQYNDDDKSIKLLWKCRTAGKILSTPRLWNRRIESSHNKNQYLAACSINGFMSIVNAVDGSLYRQSEISDGEIFSTPEILDNRLFVGSRDNFLYCYEVEFLL